MATTWLPASSQNRHRLLRRLLEKTSTGVRNTWTIDNNWPIETHEFEMVFNICEVVQSSSLGVWPNRCCAGGIKQVETCTERPWQHLNMSELSETPTTSTLQQSKHMACASNFARVSSSVVCCGSLCFLGCTLRWHVARTTRTRQVKQKSDRSMITAMRAEQCQQQKLRSVRSWSNFFSVPVRCERRSCF